MSSLSLPLFLVGLLACGDAGSPASPAPSDEPLRQPVIYGSVELGEEATVLLASREGIRCSGSVITPTVVMTANHCVEGSEPGDWSVRLGWSADFRVEASVVEIVAPGPFTDESEDDLALLVVDEPIPVAPYLAAWELDPELPGSEVKIVGFGLDESEDSGVRKSGSMFVVRIGELQLELSGHAFPGSGDSGGPVLDSEGRVIAVISRAGDGHALVTRVDQLRWLLDPVLRREGGCVPGDPEVCDTLDNNCDLVVDEGCLALGDPCESVDLCPTQRCEEVDGQSRCTLPCTVEDPAACWEGTYCREVQSAQDAQCGSGFCLQGEPGAGATGDECAGDLECESLVCRDPGDGVGRCTTRCTPDRLECPAGQVCAPLGGCGGCFPEAIASWPRGLGEPCSDDGQCSSGTCLHETARAYCSGACDPLDRPCPGGMHCRDGACLLGDPGDVGSLCVSDEDCREELVCWAQPGLASLCVAQCGERRTYCPPRSSCDFDLSVCVPEGLPLGSPCDPEARAPCTQGACIQVGERFLCSIACSEGCPDGFVCGPEVDGVPFCEPGRMDPGAGCSCAAAGRAARVSHPSAHSSASSASAPAAAGSVARLVLAAVARWLSAE